LLPSGKIKLSVSRLLVDARPEQSVPATWLELADQFRQTTAGANLAITVALWQFVEKSWITPYGSLLYFVYRIQRAGKEECDGSRRKWLVFELLVEPL
jgi:hypothetical protein